MLRNPLPPRFKYRHTVAAAARELAIPEGYLWSWLLSGRLKYRERLGRIWVKLSQIECLLANRKAVFEALCATGEPISRE